MSGRTTSLWRIVSVAAMLALSLGTSGGAGRAAPAHAHPPLALTANGSDAAELRGELGDEWLLTVRLDGPLPRGEYIAIVTGTTLVRSCTKTPCADYVASETARTLTYQGILYTKKQRLNPASNPITIEWKHFRTKTIVSAPKAAYTIVKSTPPFSVTMLAGIPFRLKLQFPDGIPSYFTTMKLKDLSTNEVVEKWNMKPEIAGRQVYRSREVILDEPGALADLEAEVLGPTGEQVSLLPVTTFKALAWNVEIEAAGKNGSNAANLSLNPGEAATVTAVITEPKVQTLTKYIDSLEIASDKVEKKCPHAWTCSVPVTRSSQGTVDFGGHVYTINSKGVRTDVAVPKTVSVVWQPPLTITVKPGLTSKDMAPHPPGSLNGSHSVTISGVITHTFTASGGQVRTECEDYLYAETVNGRFDCNGPWPEPDGQDVFRTEDDTSLVLVLATCEAFPCNNDNQLLPPTPRPDFSQSHTYTTTITDGDIIGTTAFWASPLGFLDQDGHVQTGFSGGFTVTISR